MSMSMPVRVEDPAVSMPAPVFLTAAWRSLVMLNFDVEPRLVAPHVPRGTVLDLWQNRSLVSLVGFRFVDTRLWGCRLPGYGDFDEVNLRLYVKREMPDGWRRGVVFVKEVVPKYAVTIVARWIYNENYVTLPVTHDVRLPTAQKPGHQEESGLGGFGRYRWGCRGSELEMTVHLNGFAQPLVPQSEAEFITEHYWGYTRQRDGSTLEYSVEHPPWNVWPAVTAELRGNATALYGRDFGAALARPPCSAFLADGSEVTVRRGVRIG